nr:MAG TPA: hypothetical protein [Caudoviricetes sp.]
MHKLIMVFCAILHVYGYARSVIYLHTKEATTWQ